MAMNISAALRINAGVTGQQSIDQLRTSLDKLNGSAKSVGSGFSAVKTAVGGFLALEAVRGITEFASSLMDAADNLVKMSAKTGMSVEALSELSFAADLSGVSIDQVQAAMTKLAVKATAAASGNKDAAIAFEGLGISVKDASGHIKSQSDLLDESAEALSRIKDPTIKAAMAVELFGKSGTTLIPLLDTLKESRQEARDLGVVVGTDFAKKSEEFNDNMTRMTGLSKAFGMALLEDVLPSLNRVMEKMIEAKKAGGFWDALMGGAKQGIIEFGTDFSNIDAEITRITEMRAKLVTMKADLSKDTWANAINNAVSGDLAIVTGQIATLDEQLKQLQATKEKVTGGLGTPKGGAGSAGSGSADAAASAALAAAANAKAREEAEKAALKLAEERKSILDGLADSVNKLSRSEEENTVAKLRSLGASEREIELARQRIRESVGLKASETERQNAIKSQNELDAEAIRLKEQLADAGKKVYEDTRTPLEKLNAEMDRLNKLLAKGAIDWDTYSRAQKQAEDEFDKVGKKGQVTMEDLKDAVDGWGKEATQAFVDFAFTGKTSFGSMVASILKDMASMAVQAMVIGPLMQAFKSILPATFADGGIMTSGGSMPLKKYSNGGIANSPQLAMFGEGRMPEAYVPLPDGRSIPVTMKGDGGGSTSVIVNVNVESGREQISNNQGASALGKIIAGSVRQELINQKRPGGLLAA